MHRTLTTIRCIARHRMIITRYCRQYVPPTPMTSRINESIVDPASTILDRDLIDHLEQLSLVRFTNADAIHHLQKAIGYANRLHQLDTTDVEPMETVLEHIDCALRDDRVTDGGCRQQVLSNASELLDDYFVTPPGNIPLEKAT